MIYSTLHTRQMEVVGADTLDDDMKLIAEGVEEVSGKPVTHVLKQKATGTIVAYCSDFAHAEAYRQALEAMNHSLDADTNIEAKPIVKRPLWRKALHWLGQFLP
jgi:acetyl-CoA carboxylase alpha subunit